MLLRMENLKTRSGFLYKSYRLIIFKNFGLKVNFYSLMFGNRYLVLSYYLSEQKTRTMLL